MLQPHYVRKPEIFADDSFQSFTSVELFGSVCVYRRHMIQTHYVRTEEDFQVTTVFKVLRVFNYSGVGVFVFIDRT